MCPFIGCSSQISTAVGLGTAVTFVSALTSIINYCVYHFILARFGLEHLQFIVFIACLPILVLLVRYSGGSFAGLDLVAKQTPLRGSFAILFRLPLIFFEFCVGYALKRIIEFNPRVIFFLLSVFISFGAFFVLGFVKIWRKAKNKDKYALFLWLSLILVVMLALIVICLNSVTYFESRHMSILSPFLYVVLAVGISVFIKYSYKMAIIFCFLIFVLTMGSYQYLYSTDKYPNSSKFKEAALYLSQHSLAEDVLILQKKRYFLYAFQYYKHGKAIEYELGEEDVPVNITNLTRSKDRVWLLRGTGWESIDPEDRIKEWLDSHMKMLEHKKFNGIKFVIDLYLYKELI